MKTFEVDGVVLEVTRGDIASQDDVDAVVNAANARLEIGGGVALDTVLSTLDELEQVRRIRFVLYSHRDREIYERKLAEKL